MTRRQAIETIYQVINSGILYDELEEELVEVCNSIEEDSFEDDVLDKDDDWEED